MTTPAIALSERALVGGALLFPDRIPEAPVRPADFLSPIWGSAWLAMQELVREGQTPDVVLVSERSKAGPAELAEAVSNASGSLAYLGREVREAAITREVHQLLERLRLSDEAGVQLVAKATSELARIQLPQACGGATLREGLAHTVDRIDRMMDGASFSGLRTGLSDLDDAVRGIPYRVVTVIAGRPQAGKSALALQIAAAVAERGEQVDFWSLEDSAENVHRRLLASRGRIPLDKLTWGGLSEQQAARMMQAAAELHRFGDNLFIGDELPADAEQFALEVERQALRRKSKLVVIDFIQLLRMPGFKSRNEELTAISLRLKAIPKTTGAALVVLSQLSREAERDDRPRAHHLRDCGSIEQDAHIIILLHKPEWMTNEEDKPLPIDLVYIDKNKDVGPAKCSLFLEGKYVRFGDMTPDLRDELRGAFARRKASSGMRRR